MIKEIYYIKEPSLVFGNNQKTEDPHDGLLLFGPYEKWGTTTRFKPFTIDAALIGPESSLELYMKFVNTIKSPIVSKKRNQRGEIISNEIQRPSFLGFETIFNIEWPDTPSLYIEIKEKEWRAILSERYNKLRTTRLVELYLNKMLKNSKEDSVIHIWFVVVPKEVFVNCRPLSEGKDFSAITRIMLEREKEGQEILFADESSVRDEIDNIMDSSSDFHHLLKARANQSKLEAPIQIIVQPKLKFRDIATNIEYSDDMKAHIAWSLSTTLYYKLGKKPWKVSGIRPGVCYLGLVFKKLPNSVDQPLICSAAQLFLDDGDGTIFRGKDGLWMSEGANEYHLDQKGAFSILDQALLDYYEKHQEYPKELFIHGRANFSDDEWNGFNEAIFKHSKNIRLYGIVIQDKSNFKLFRDVENEKSDYGVLRGIAAILNEKEAFLFTNGYIPRLKTSNHMEVANPLHVRITRGNADIKIVLEDIMALTKLNYNACIYGDGKPVTLRFSDTIGSILTANEKWENERRNFKYFI